MIVEKRYSLIHFTQLSYNVNKNINNRAEIRTQLLMLKNTWRVEEILVFTATLLKLTLSHTKGYESEFTVKLSKI